MSAKRRIKKALEEHELLHKNSCEILSKMVENNWIGSFAFTPRHGELDIHGIDLSWSFKPGPNGELGKSGAQEKTRWKDVKVHFKRYPCVPLYLLRPGDSKEQIEYVYIILFLTCRSYNLSGEQEIERRKKILEDTEDKEGRKIVDREKRVWLNWEFL